MFCLEHILRTNRLTKQYKGEMVVHDLNMNIKKGEIYGFLGKNGAGKTTTIRMIMGLIDPTAGEIELFEKREQGKNRPYGKIGTIIEVPGFYPNLTGQENLEIHRRYMGVQEKSSIKEALELVGLHHAGGKKVKNYSLGMKQRLGLARAILHHPSFLILDEPTNGLDPEGIKQIRKLILDLVEKLDITVLVSSHILSEIEQLATKIGIIHRGKLIQELSLEDINEKNKQYIQVEVNEPEKTSVILEQKLNIHQYQMMDEGKIRIYDHTHHTESISKTLMENGIGITSIHVNADTLEDYFLHLTEGD